MSFIIITPDLNYLDDIVVDTDKYSRADQHHFIITKSQPIAPDTYTRAHHKSINIIELSNYNDDQILEHQIEQLMANYDMKRIIAPNESDIARAAQLRTRFNLPGMAIENAAAFTNKHLMKNFLTAKGLKVPAYDLIQTPTNLKDFVHQHLLPVIIKPLQGTGCQGIRIIDTEAQLNEYCDDKKCFNEPLLVEQYIRGTLYNINGIVDDNKVVAVWPSMYWRSPDQLLIGKSASSFLMSENNPLTFHLNDYACRVVAAMPGPSSYTFHLEAFVEDQQIEPIFCEIAARVGGKGVNQSWKVAFNINLKNIDFMIQAGRQYPGVTLPLKPEMLCAEVWFPQVEGKLVKKAEHCPFEWVKNYHDFAILNKSYQKPNNIEAILGGSSLIVGNDEKEITDRIIKFENWFYENHIIIRNDN